MIILGKLGHSHIRLVCDLLVSKAGAHTHQIDDFRDSDLFRQTILQSGSALGPWASLRDTMTKANELADAANCTDRNSTFVVECLRNLSTDQLQEIYTSISGPTPNYQFTTRVDGELFSQNELRELNSGKPAIIGVNSGEMPLPHGKYSSLFFGPLLLHPPRHALLLPPSLRCS